MYFESKKDTWLTIITWTIVLLGILAPAVKGAYVSSFVLVLIGAFLLWFWFRTGYLITEKELIIYYGPIRQRMLLNKIDTVLKSKMPLISPALSMDRIQVRGGKYDIVAISPKDKAIFIEELINRNPDLLVDESLQKKKGE